MGTLPSDSPDYAILLKNSWLVIMVRWNATHRAFAVEAYIRYDEKMVLVRREFKRKFGLKRHENPPHHKTILLWVKNFRESAKATSASKPGRRRSVRTPENVEKVRVAVLASPGRSARKQSVALQIPRTSLRRIIKDDLNMHPYKLQITQELLPSDRPKRFEFCTQMLDLLEEKEVNLEDIFFSDEAHFDLHGNVNKQNMRYYAECNPKITCPKPLHSPRVTVWCAVSARAIVGPYFFEDDAGSNVTVNGDRYLKMLDEFFLPSLRRRRIPLSRTWFQQDGATAHIRNDVLTLLRQKFPGRLISRNCDFVWPPRSPDLTPPDFFLWGHLKSKVYQGKPRDLEALKTAITKHIGAISRETLEKVMENFCKRLKECKRRRGKHLNGVSFKK